MTHQLSADDLAALRARTTDISDIPAADQARYRAGFARAYATCEAVRRGELPAMSSTIRECGPR